MKKLNITAIILTHDEEDNIARAIKSVHFCKEILVIDDYSKDKTIMIAKKLGATVDKRKLQNDFSAQRNWAMRKAKYDWVLFLDADEEISKELAYEISDAIQEDFSGFYVHRVDVLWGRVISHGEIGSFGAFGNAKILRLGKKGEGLWVRKIHERWRINGKTRILSQRLLHYPHQSLSEFISDISKRSTIHAQMLRKERKKPYFSRVLLWPPGKFLYNMTLKIGFLDGMPGFIVATLMSFHSFLSWSELWLKKSKN